MRKTRWFLLAPLALAGCTDGDPGPAAPPPARFDVRALSPAQAEHLRVQARMPLYVLGDADGDLRLDETDLAVLDAQVGRPAGAGCVGLADLDHDGVLGPADRERLLRRIASFRETGALEAVPRMKVGSCPAILPFVAPELPGRPAPGKPATPTVHTLAPGLQLSAAPVRVAVNAPVSGRADDGRAVHDPFTEIAQGGVTFVVPVARRADATAGAATLTNPEGAEKLPIETGEARYARGLASGHRTAPIPASCPHEARRGASFVVNLLCDWKYADDQGAQDQQDDYLSRMYRALARPEIDNDVFRYVGYEDARLYPRPKRLVYARPQKGLCRPSVAVESETLEVGDQAEITFSCLFAEYTVTAPVISEATTIAHHHDDVARWREDQRAAKATMDGVFADFERAVGQGASAVFFYVGSHGSPPDDGDIPEGERYGYWSTGLGWAIWWNRADLLGREHAAAARAGTCWFTALDDSCYSGYTARFGQERAVRCDDRPAHAETWNGEHVFANRWLGVSTDARLAGLDECLAREQELVDGIGRAIAQGYPKDWLFYLYPDNFGQAYVDRGSNAAECAPPPTAQRPEK
jgi:hypothetical protein